MLKAAVSLAPQSVAGALPDGVQIKPYQSALGAVVRGFKYRGSVLPELQAAFKQALLDHGLLIFKSGSVQHAEFMEFVSLFGAPALYSGPHTPAVQGASLANTVDSANDDHLRNHVWHVDGTFRANPNKYTALFGYMIPEQGGDTVFSNAVLAYELLDPLFAAYLDTLTAVNSADATGHLATRFIDQQKLAEERARLPPIEVPVIRVHPETSRKQIFVNESYTGYIKGLSRTVSDHLLGILFDAVKSADVQARITWEQGDVVIWDNRTVQHRGIKDYGKQRRILHRASLN
jgi:taurine dioxygenase